jgi:hypothetical protein
MKALNALLYIALALGIASRSASAECGACTGGVETISWKGWSFQYVRPCLTRSTTAGGRGGGLEIRNAKFNGRSVFSKGNTPIFNVKYQNNLCGPYRDWQYEESSFKCDNVVPTSLGRCNGPARTNCADPALGDIGSFCGVSVDTSSSTQIVLTTMLKAGWYRYEVKWTFYADGSFRPSINWTGVSHPCINNAHLHNAYFRVDFDIEGETPNVVEEYKDPATSPVGYWELWDPLFTEMSRMRDSAKGVRKWRVRNTTTKRGYLILPMEETAVIGGGDGVATSTGIADFWALRYSTANQEETDDCAATTPLCSISSGQGYWAHLDRFVTATSDPNYLVGKDTVIWYGASHMHPGSPTQTPPKCDRDNGPLFAPDTSPDAVAW